MAETTAAFHSSRTTRAPQSDVDILRDVGWDDSGVRLIVGNNRDVISDSGDVIPDIRDVGWDESDVRLTVGDSGDVIPDRCDDGWDDSGDRLAVGDGIDVRPDCVVGWDESDVRLTVGDSTDVKPYSRGVRSEGCDVGWDESDIRLTVGDSIDVRRHGCDVGWVDRDVTLTVGDSRDVRLDGRALASVVTGDCDNRVAKNDAIPSRDWGPTALNDCTVVPFNCDARLGNCKVTADSYVSQPDSGELKTNAPDSFRSSEFLPNKVAHSDATTKNVVPNEQDYRPLRQDASVDRLEDSRTNVVDRFDVIADIVGGGDVMDYCPVRQDVSCSRLEDSRTNAVDHFDVIAGIAGVGDVMDHCPVRQDMSCGRLEDSRTNLVDRFDVIAGIVSGGDVIDHSPVRQDVSCGRLEDSRTNVVDRFDVIAGIVSGGDVIDHSPVRQDVSCGRLEDSRTNAVDRFDVIADIVGGGDVMDQPPVRQDVSVGRPEDSRTNVVDRFDVIAGIVSGDVTSHSCNTRPDIMEDCDCKLYSSSNCDMADVCGIVLQLEDCYEIKPDIVDKICDVKCNRATVESVTKCGETRSVTNHCETRPDVVDDSDITSNNTSVTCISPPGVSELCASQSKVPTRGPDGNGGDVGVSSDDASHSPVVADRVEVEIDAVDARPGTVGHLLKLVRALANNLGTDLETPSAGGVEGNTNFGFDDTESPALGDRSEDQASQTSSDDDIDWSWLADETQLCAASNRPSSWLRASMRRVRRFALGEPQARVATTPSNPMSTTVAVRSSAPPCPTGDDDDADDAPSRLRSVATRPSRSLSDNTRPSCSNHIPDILNSVNTSRSIVPPSRCLSARIPRPPTEVPSAPSVWTPDDDTPVPSAPPESPRIPRDPDDFPRRYSHLGRLEGRRPPEPPEQPSEPSTEDESNSDYEEPEETRDWWPHSLSSLLASLGCTLGLFNVSRFAILSVHFGANFVIQFLFLSLVVGWPLYTLYASLGQHLKAGVVDMWRISPLFQGIGIALLLAQAMLGLYSVVGVAWMFTYFRDSFINKYDAYRWAENGTKVEDSIPEYLNTVVLQRQGSSTVGHLKFQVTFNLAVVWMIVFVCLSKGVKSYGKSVYLFATVPIFGISILAIKVLTLTDIWFDHTAWNELFMNSNCWTAAAIECVMTWGLLGAATMQMRSHSACCRLSRECLAVGAITVATLVSAALLANGFAQLLWSNNLRYVPSSFEHSAVFLTPVGAPRLSSTPVRWMSHGHHVVGLQVSLPGAPPDTISGYQAAQFATELAPAVFAKLGPQSVSPFWTVLFYFTLILLGISQQLCIWHCVITGIMAINITRLRSWETTITFLSCSCGFVLGLPMTTELGVAVVYFMDYCVGGAWWLILLQAAQIIAALMAQGGEQVAHTLLGSRRSCLQAFVVFTWNVVLPLALTVVSVTWFRSNHYRDLYSSRHHGYWPAWARRLGCLLQLLPLIIVPLVAAVQTWRYLTRGPNDLFDRLRLLCRPGPSDPSTNQTATPTVSSPSQPLPEMTAVDDPPPKYTPPPSYSTATGARIAKMLRRSFRRLVAPSVPSPPDYSAVLVEMGGAETAGRTSTLSAVEVAHILRSSMRRTLRRDQVRSAPSPTQDSSKTEPVI